MTLALARRGAARPTSTRLGGSRRRAAGGVCGLAVLLLCLHGAGPALAYPRLFDSTEIRSDALTGFPKWTGTLQRYAKALRRADQACRSKQSDACRLQDWRRFLRSLAGMSRLDQVRMVNRYVNGHPYIVDPVNWGVRDYWATPFEFFRKDGDCEDYAIAKFMSLRQLGLGNDALRIAVVQDTNLNIAHAVLVVYVDDHALVLDNQVAEVVDAVRIKHYRPFYSINEESWWLHKSVGE